MNVSRRDLLKWTFGSAILASGVTLADAAEKGARKGRRTRAGQDTSTGTKKIPIGLQLYSVRKDCEKDLPGVLKAVAQMGYKGVEFAGYYGRSAQELRKLLDDNGLVCCGTHTALNTLTGDAWKGTVEFNKTIGNKFLIVPSLPQKNVASKEAVLETAKVFNELVAKGKAEGMRVGYHAHGGDFKKFGDETVWDLLFGNAAPELVMQIDIGNTLDGGGDPYAMLRKYPHRAITVHLKEHGGKRGAVIGEGEVKWNEVFQLCETTGDTEWYIVEQEAYGSDTPLEAAKKCLEGLKKMGKA